MALESDAVVMGDSRFERFVAVKATNGSWYVQDTVTRLVSFCGEEIVAKHRASRLNAGRAKSLFDPCDRTVYPEKPVDQG